MCYSAEVWADYHQYTRVWGAELSIKDFYRIYFKRRQLPMTKIPKAMDAAFSHPQSSEEHEIKAMIDEFNSQQSAKMEADIFKQRKRLADAERTLQTKTTKKALEDQRIATEKVEWGRRKLADISRTELKGRDSRIFPGWYAPVMVIENGRRVVKPMRYQCRLAGKPASFDRDFSGCYNARRDNLARFWKAQFGVSHGVMVVKAFYENVSRHAMEGRALEPDEKEENVELEFRPKQGQDMLVACLWSRWVGPDEELLSFAAITDEPPAEVAAAGHDRCIIPIDPNNIDAWLAPEKNNLSAQQAILDDRERPYYEHRMAA